LASRSGKSGIVQDQVDVESIAESVPSPTKNDELVVVNLKNEHNISEMIPRLEGWEDLSGSDV
jgi:hypothetical protein